MEQVLKKKMFTMMDGRWIVGYTDGGFDKHHMPSALVDIPALRKWEERNTEGYLQGSMVDIQDDGSCTLHLADWDERFNAKEYETVDGNRWLYDVTRHTAVDNGDDWQPAEAMDEITTDLGLEWDTDDNIEAVLNYIRDHCDKSHFVRWIKDVAESEAAVIDGNNTWSPTTE